MSPFYTFFSFLVKEGSKGWEEDEKNINNNNINRDLKNCLVF